MDQKGERVSFNQGCIPAKDQELTPEVLQMWAGLEQGVGCSQLFSLQGNPDPSFHLTGNLLRSMSHHNHCLLHTGSSYSVYDPGQH